MLDTWLALAVLAIVALVVVAAGRPPCEGYPTWERPEPQLPPDRMDKIKNANEMNLKDRYQKLLKRLDFLNDKWGSDDWGRESGPYAGTGPGSTPKNTKNIKKRTRKKKGVEYVLTLRRKVKCKTDDSGKEKCDRFKINMKERRKAANAERYEIEQEFKKRNIKFTSFLEQV